MSNEELSEEKFWGKKLKEHWKALAIGITGAIVAFIGVLLVLIWFITVSPIGRFGLASIAEWNLDWVVGAMILITVWVLLFVGVPSALFFGLGGYLFWRSLPAEEKKEFKDRDKKEKARRKEKYGGGGGGSFGIFIAYCLYHFIIAPQTYFTPFGDLPYTYWLSTWFLTVMWIFIVLGIPALIILTIVYFTYWRKKSEKKIKN